ncbi:MAG: hypothetical protein ACK5V3_01135 [Bdellovibrionales bacterium]
MKLSLLGLLLFSQLSMAESPIHFAEDVPLTLKKFVIISLNTMSQISGKGSTPLHDLIFQGPVDGRVYRDWFFKRVKKIAMSPSCNFTARIDSEGEPGVIYISKCVNLNPDRNQTAYWLSILFHEARHLEPHNKYWHHSLCLDNSSMVMSCDQSPMGPFGLEKILFGNLVKYCSNCSQDFMTQAQAVLEDEQVWQKIDDQSTQAIQKDLRLK